jgi:hypothetical protein
LGGTFTNTTAPQRHRDRDDRTTVPVSIVSVKATNAPAGACTAADYALLDLVMAAGADVPVGANVGSWGGALPAEAASIWNNNIGTHQDGRELATLNLAYAIA